MAHDVFISYSHKDYSVAQAICAKLEEQKIRCWYAPRNIGAGEEWASSIMNALKESKIMVLVFTDYSNASKQVKREVDNAINAGVTIIPFKLTENNPSGAMEYYLATLHWLDALNKPLENSIDELVTMVRNIMEGKELPDDDINADWKKEAGKRGKKKSTLQTVFRVFSSIFALAMAFMGLGIYSTNPTFNYDVSVIMFYLGLISLIAGLYLLVALFWKKRPRNSWIYVLVTCILLFVFMIVRCIQIGGAKPANMSISGKSEEISQNMANFSFVVRDEKDNVYYMDVVNGTSGLYQSNLQDFYNGKQGKCLISNLEADNLTLGRNGILYYRINTEPNIICAYDLNTGTNKQLKKTPASHLYGTNDVVIFNLETFSRGVMLLSYDGRYENSVIENNYTNLNIYKGEIYFLDEYSQFGHYENSGFSQVLSNTINGYFIIHDDMVYYVGSNGEGIYRNPLDDMVHQEKLSDAEAYEMIVHGDYLYYLNIKDNYALYRISLIDKSEELIDSSYFTSMNIIGDCLYLCRGVMGYTRLMLD